jgi:hypothetical protein
VGRTIGTATGGTTTGGSMGGATLEVLHAVKLSSNRMTSGMFFMDGFNTSNEVYFLPHSITLLTIVKRIANFQNA